MSAIQQLLTDHLDIWIDADTAKRSGRGRASGNTGSVYGIKKLRELILELAVRGKLVPQEAGDEPASELLKRIQAEKTKLVASGEIKKDKPLPPIADEEKPFELPVGWAYSNLGDVVEIVRGITFPGSEKSKTPEKGRIACLRTSNVQDQIEWEDILYIREEFVSRNDQILKPRDIVMSMANSRELVGKVALVGEKINQKTSFGGFLGVLRPFLIEPRFVMALLRTPHAREMLIDSASQTTNIANVSLAKLRPLFFAIPPLAEQHRIVAKVDELMALCDQLETQHNNATEAHEKLVSHLLGTLTQSQSAEDFSENWQRIAAHFDTLFTTEASIDALKQVLLQLAVMGKLVPQDSKDEPASAFYNHLLKLPAGYTRAGKQNIKEKNISSIESLPEIPNQWVYKSIDQLYQSKHILDYADGNHGSLYPRSNDFGDEGVIFLTAAQISNCGEIFWADCPRLNHQKAKELSKGWAAEGDVFFTHNATVGRTAYAESCPETPFLLGTSVTFYRINGGVIHPKYLLHYFSSPSWQQQAEAVMQQTTRNQVSITKQALFYVALPPVAEQQRIVAKVDELMALCDQLKTRITEANQLQQKLADVVVVKAVA